MRIINYVEMKADKFKAEIGNSQIDLFNPEDYQCIEDFKKNNPNVVRCIPLDDINSFSLTENPTEDMYKILEENGFVLNGTDEYGNDFYIRKELLLQLNHSFIKKNGEENYESNIISILV